MYIINKPASSKLLGLFLCHNLIMKSYERRRPYGKIFNKINAKTTADKVFVSAAIISFLSLVTIFIYFIITHNNKNIYMNWLYYISMVLIVVMLISAGYSIIKIGDILSKIFGTFLFAVSLLAAFLCQLLSIIKINTVNFYFYLGMFVLYCIMAIFLLIMSLNDVMIREKALSLFFGMVVYCSIILDACYMFFIYFAGNHYISNSVIQNFNNAKSTIGMTKIVIKEIIYYFNNLPQATDNKPISFYFPFYVGKFADLFLLGYIVNKIFSGNSPLKKLSDKLLESNKINSRISKENKDLLAYLIIITQLYNQNIQNHENQIDLLKSDYDRKIKGLKTQMKMKS